MLSCFTLEIISTMMQKENIYPSKPCIKLFNFIASSKKSIITCK